MFDRLGSFATHYRIPIIIAWIAVAVIVTLVAPNIGDVASSDQADLMPRSAPFIHANAVYRDTFPNNFAPSSTIIVIDAQKGGSIQKGPAWSFIGELENWLRSDAAPDNIQRVTAPTTSSAAVALLVAPDDQVAIVRVSLSTTGSDKRSGVTLDTIDQWMAQHLPDGVKAYQTGEAPIITNTNEAIQTSADRAIWVTITLVVVMLLLVYRSPVSPLVPLSAVTVAYFITRGIVAYLGAHVMTITSYANVLLVTVMYGAGTDYCLFLISRFREEMADNIGVQRATVRTVHLVGETITSSAGTIFVGFMAMSFAEMGIFNSSGPALAIGIAVGLLAGLTFTPALLATLSKYAFWPGHATHRSAGRFYELTSKQVSTRPLITILIIVGAMIPFSVYGLTRRTSYDMLADLPDDKPAVMGYRIMQDHIGAGNVMPLSVVVTGRDPNTIAADIVQMTQELSAVKGVGDVRSLNSPLGQHSTQFNDLLRVDTQLTLALQMINNLQTAETLDPQQALALLTTVQDYLDLLTTRFPEVADDPNLITIRDILNNPLQVLLRLDDLTAATAGLAERFKTVENAYLLPTTFGDLIASLSSPGGGAESELLAQLIPNYLNADSTAYRLEVILSVPPVGYEGMDTLREIRSILKQHQGTGEAVVSGGSAAVTDIHDTVDRDLLRAIGFVLLGIFLVLLLMLRSMVAPMYLIGTVLLSFTCTLGLTSLFFKIMFGVHQITWWVPFFMFVFLVALGVDYSIFLFGRLKEEVGRHGIREGVHVAVARTGAIITSAGVILAGTFAALVTGQIKGLAEIGFAVSVGVLIDTFVVRTMLDPALATLFGRWTWWPGNVPKAKPSATQPVPGSSVQPGD
jgi:RND superfamily putative drug exporter